MNQFKAEKELFDKLKDYRIHRNREFFNIDLETIINHIINLVSERMK